MSQQGTEQTPNPEGENIKEIIVTGTAMEGALDQLHQLAPELEISGKSLNDLTDESFRLRSLANQSTERREAERLANAADAVERLMIHLRPNNSILGIENDSQGRFKGLKLGIKEIEQDQNA